MFEDRQRPLVPQYIQTLKPYVAGKTIAEVDAAYNPSRIAKLASNENRMGHSPMVDKAVGEALAHTHNYPDSFSRELRQAIAERNGVSPANVIVAAGSESIIAILCRTFFLNTDEALTAEVTFVGFFVQTNIRGVRLRKVPVTEEYKYDLTAIAEAVNDYTKMIYIANPNNPTGTYVSKQEFERFMSSLPSDVLVVMDEAYFEYARHYTDYPDSLSCGYENVITLRTFSKAYGLAGFRVGYAIAHRDLITYMLKTKLTFEPTALGQAAALAAYGDEDFIEKSLQLVEEGKKRLYSFLDLHNVSYVPSAANSVMLILPSEQEAESMNQAMLEEGVILRRLPAFGLPHCIRVTIGTDEDMVRFEESFCKVAVH